MPNEQGLFDNDVLIKLISANLLEKSIQEFNIQEAKVLGSLKFQINETSSGKLAQAINKLPEHIKTNIRTTIASDMLTDLSEPVDDNFVSNCMNVHALDHGEVLLLEAAFRTPGALLITADKRFLRALGDVQWLKQKALDELPHRFICIEIILYQLIKACGFSVIQNSVENASSLFNDFKLTFGDETKKVEEMAIDYLRYEIDSLKSSLGDLLYMPEDY